MKWLREESGQVLVMTFFSMGILLGALGLAVDVGVLLHARRNMQAAADAAAMAGNRDQRARKPAFQTW